MPEKLLQSDYGLQKSILNQITATAGNVQSGIRFLDKNGNIQTGTLSLSGNASTGTVLSGNTFYSNSFTRQTGSMTNRGAWGTTINPGGSVTIPAGYHNGGGVVYANPSLGGPWDQDVTTGYTYDPSRFVSVPNHPETKVRVDAIAHVWFVVERGVVNMTLWVDACMWSDGYQNKFGAESNNWSRKFPLNG